MGYARKTLICLNETPYYHVIARCVRRAWLWGFDQYAGKDYSHRKFWVVDRVRVLSTVFAIDVCAYAVMSNHYHLVLHVDRARSRAWTPQQVLERWTILFGVPAFVQRWRDGTACDAEREAALVQVECWRARLNDVSWYMRCLNEYLARRANAEDQCTGRFWEGRFKSQALLDEAGLLTAMAYVDLNPVRAGIAETPEESAFTSVQARIQELRAAPSATTGRRTTSMGSNVPLLPFRRDARVHSQALPFNLLDYVQLLDWSGRHARAGKSAIDESAPPVLMRLNIDTEAWRTAIGPAGNVFGRALGELDHLRLHAKALGQAWIKGLRRAERMYRTA